MKKILSLVGLLFICSIISAQNIRVHNSGNTMYANSISSVDSIKLDATYSRFNIAGSAASLDIQKALIDSMTFTNNAVTLNKIYIIYNGTDNATIINPYASQGLTITASGGKVTATGATGISNLEYNLLGTSSAGSLALSSTTPATFVMNNLNITNASGPAIIITGSQTHTFVSQAGTTNTLTDGSGNSKNGTLQTDGKVIFAGAGALVVKGVKKHAVYTTSSIEVQSSAVTVSGAASDGLHSEGFTMSGGAVTVAASSSDGIDAGDGAISITDGAINVTSTAADVKALKTGNGTITISGGTFNLNISGNASKAISAKGVITINAGTFTINLSGAATLTASGSGYDPSYCTGIKSDLQINVNGGNFTIVTTSAAAGAKAFSADSDILLANGTFNITTAGGGASYTNISGVADSYSTTAFSSDTKISVSGGTYTLVNSGADGKQFSSDGTIDISGGTINITNSGSSGKGFKADGNIVFSGGNTTINLSGATVLNASGSGYDPSYPTGIKATGSITVNTGSVISVTGTSAATGAKGLSGDNGVIINGGSVTTLFAGNGANYTTSTGAADSYSAAGISSDADITVAGGTLNLTNSGSDGKNVNSDANIIVSGGTINLVNSGTSGKGYKADANITFNGGNSVINLSGATVLNTSGSGYDPSYPTGAKATGVITVNKGAVISVTGTSAATGAKGLSGDGGVVINDGAVTTSLAGNGANYTAPTGVADSYSAAGISSDANITIAGGTLKLTNSGSDGKNVNSDASIFVNGGSVTLVNSGSSGKGYNADANVVFNGGNSIIKISGATVLNASGSGYDPSYPTGVRANKMILVNAGTIIDTATTAATGARGLSADSAINVVGGTVSIYLQGDGAKYTNTSGTSDSYAAAAFSSDTAITITGGTVITSCSGTGGKGLKCDRRITIGSATGSPTLNITTTGTRFLVSGTDYCHPKTIVASGAISIINGTLTINSTDDGIHSDSSITISGGNTTVVANSSTQGMGEGIEAPIINFVGGVTNVTASNDGINATYGTVSGGTESDDNSQLNISGGILIVAGSDAIDSNGDITITGGTTIVCGPTSQPEEGMDFNGTFLMNGGLLIAAGSNSSMTKTMSSTSTQVSMFIKSNSQLAATSVLHIESSTGTEMVTFKPKNGVYYFHFSSPGLALNTAYKIYFGGSYTGGSFVGGSSGWGVYTGGTYSSASANLKTTVTPTSKVTTVSFN